MISLSRRSFIARLAVAAVGTPTAPWAAYPAMTVHVSPGLACCIAWVEQIRAAGFDTQTLEMNDLATLKSRLAIPPTGWSCHIAEIGGFVIEGHVPPSAVHRLLLERPDAIGVTVAGLPSGSPGVTAQGADDERFDVVLYGPTVRKNYARFKGAREIRLPI